MSSFSTSPMRSIDSALIDRILDKGQRLRNAMVQTILTNDPFYVDSSPKTTKTDEQPSSNKIRAFLQGDYMPREEERSVFETICSMSPAELCKATERSYKSSASCSCSTCVNYNDQKSNPKNVRQARNLVDYLQYVDSLKISVKNISLNERGEKKLSENLSNNKVAAVSQSFFIEYEIPPEIKCTQSATRSKTTDSGLDLNLVRFCATRNSQGAIIFNQSSVHNVCNLDKFDLNELSVKFRISYRHFKQKHPVTFGAATFKFSDFHLTKNFSCNEELSIRINESTPLVLGTVLVSLQLGCGRLYFGREFLNGITQNKENSIISSEELSESAKSEKFDSKRIELRSKSVGSGKCLLTQRSNTLEKEKNDLDAIKKGYFDRPEPRNFLPEHLYRKKFQNATKKLINVTEKAENVPPLKDNIILFGFLRVFQAKFKREVLNSFISCDFFAQGVRVQSDVVNKFGSNPEYNFSQQISLIYDEKSFQDQFRENFMVLEFHEKNNGAEFRVGLTKLSLNQFYLAYRNRTISKYLIETPDPIVAIDGWQSIINQFDEPIGRVYVLLALGTKQQIDSFVQKRNSKDISCEVAQTPRVDTPKIDIGIQSDQIEQAIMEEAPTKETSSNSIETLLSQLVAQKSRNIHVENSTNTETPLPPPTSPQNLESLRSTSELFNTLQKALNNVDKKSCNFFKAQVAVNNAMHLPSRKKCKSKKNKGKKLEDILPSTYVTFEVGGKGEMKMTQIVPKNTNPQWDFKCDVAIPNEYLTNGQKGLIFKVWRKATNTTMLPNFQTDVIIGIASVDLTVLSAGLPSVQGWYNITDLTKKCNGQINIHVTPLEPIARKNIDNPNPITVPLSIDSTNEDGPGELLGRALKRKFTELDEITQRLRLRLSSVTNDESDASNDEIADEFERDINTLCVEDDFDMVDFEKEAQSFNVSRRNEKGSLQSDDVNLNKQKLDSLLEKLTLLSGENSRYVSGCSQQDKELNDLDQDEENDNFGGLLKISESDDCNTND